MEAGPSNNPNLGTDSQDSDDYVPERKDGKIKFGSKSKKVKPITLTPKGVDLAKKRLRAFSIQKKTPLSPILGPKPVSTGSNATVYIGKLAGAKPSLPKPEPDPTLEVPKKPPKPPKPGARHIQENYVSFRRKTLEEIEDMKRKMELVELGIPLGLICPTPNSDKAMPTKAMPPIKSFIAPAKVDELIREAKRAKAEGRDFKFDYHKLLPDYDNPFQRKKDDSVSEIIKVEDIDVKIKDKDKSKGDKHESRKHSNQDEKRHKDDKYKDREHKYKDDSHRDRSKDKKKSRFSDIRPKDSGRSREKDQKRKVSPTPKRDEKSVDRESKKSDKNVQETDVNLKDFFVCDSWSDHEEKSKDSTPENEDKNVVDEKQLTPELEIKPIKNINPVKHIKKDLTSKEKSDSPKPKIERLKPVIDAFKFEIEDQDNNDDSLDIFDENLSTENFAKITKAKPFYDSPLGLDDSKDAMDLADDTFLESVINEIKQEEMDDSSQDKGLVEYDESPIDTRESVTPELNDKAREICSSRSDYSDSFKSVESDCKSSESGYKSVESKLSESLKEAEMPKHTAQSLETWSFVLKICQPLLFRHDKNKCYKETRTCPNIWFTENPKLCNCVKDRRIVYKELEMCKMDIVDTIYGSEQVFESTYPTARGWYPSTSQCLTESSSIHLSNEWEAEDSQPEADPTAGSTPEPQLEMSLDKEYQRFMEAVWPEVTERSETPRSTPVRREHKKKLDDVTDDRKLKKVKLSSEGWSQESDVEDEIEKSKSKKLKVEKPKRKRKHSSTSVSEASESDAKKRKKTPKKKENKKVKSKDLLKRRRIIKKNIRKLNKKEKKKKKLIKMEEDSDNKDREKEKKKKEKRIKKKKQLKEKKKNAKKKKSRVKSSSSSSSSSSSDSESEKERIKKKKDKKKKKRKSTESNQEELFDVNILNNIKTERLTDEEKMDLSFSPRRKPREIINVKELQNDFVGIQIKKEVEERKEVEESRDEKRQDEEKEEVQKEDSQQSSEKADEKEPEFDVKEREEQSTPQLRPEESNQSQCSSQESIYSLKDQPPYEKDESHLRPSSQNSNYSFNDVINSGHYKGHEKGQEVPHEHDISNDPDISREQKISREREMSRDRELPLGHEISRKHKNTREREICLKREVSRDHGNSRESESFGRHQISREREFSREHEVSRDREMSLEHISQEHENSRERKMSRRHELSRRHEISREREISRRHELSQEHEISRDQEMSLEHEISRKREFSRNYEFSRDHENSRDHGASRERNISREHESSRERNISQEHETSRERNISREHESLRERNISREHETSRERNFSREHETSRERNISREHEASRERNISREHEASRERNISREHETSREHNISREHETSRERKNSHGHEISRKHEVSRDHDISRDHEMEEHEISRHLDMDGEYEHGDYEMYEQMAMAYQSDVASQSAWAMSSGRTDPRQIETVVRGRDVVRGEIKCDWRAGDTLAEKPHRPSRWGLKPGEVNIVLTEGDYTAPEPVYKIQSIANRTDNVAIGYDEAYMDMYGASDRLQYGDCFSTKEESTHVTLAPGPAGSHPTNRPRGPEVLGPGAAADPRRAARNKQSSLDDRIDLALRTTVLGEVAGAAEDKGTTDKGILVTKSLSINEGRGVKRVSFADGYKPGQDSDTEQPPIKKKKKSRRLGCAWPCPATHPDHVPLWDALPPPPPPASPPPPLAAPAPPLHLLRHPPPHNLLQPPPHLLAKLDANGMPAFMPPEPPPGLISF